ncbi:MAG: 4-(cytidine 5'-diphospho)-2-C-methyl-D-erythritol kinase [Thermoflavifilum sp.]|nr:4-(cytidine 5'-diphospho)-2-C-methyl-D-erythritol kinase [Thermoflavifilum sp.]MCL6513760.1 4-(cytidine 5'-diphospho)-2-C-methyl-D-erythritol kinase [Alicyclobacillus sp.]
MILERAYAKINLTLDVLFKRSDGYHEVDMVMQSIDLSDTLWLEPLDADRVEIDSAASHIPLDGRNLAAIAAQVFRRRLGIRRGVRIYIDKQVPVAAGLGGGSADAAAVLRGLNRLWQTGLSVAELAAMGAEIGSDVPFCVAGGCAVATGRGELLQPVMHPFRPYVVLVRPAVHVSTSEVYGALTPADYSPVRHSTTMLDALASGSVDAVDAAVYNGLAPCTFQRYPGVAAMQRRVAQISQRPVHMSGSGPTLYCLLPNRNAALRLYNAIRGFTRDVYVARFVMPG